MLGALCHGPVLEGLLLGVWLLVWDRGAVPWGTQVAWTSDVSWGPGGTRGMSGFCCTSVVVMPCSQVLTVR